MSEAPNGSPPARSPGQLALSVMGYLELTLSVILLVLDLAVAAGAFGVAALFVTFVATQVRKQQIDYRRRSRRLPGPANPEPPARRRPGAAFWVQLGGGAVLIVLSVVFALLGNYAFAVNFVLWGLTLVLFAQRTAQPVEA